MVAPTGADDEATLGWASWSTFVESGLGVVCAVGSLFGGGGGRIRGWGGGRCPRGVMRRWRRRAPLSPRLLALVLRFAFGAVDADRVASVGGVAVGAIARGKVAGLRDGLCQRIGFVAISSAPFCSLTGVLSTTNTPACLELFCCASIAGLEKAARREWMLPRGILSRALWVAATSYHLQPYQCVRRGSDVCLIRSCRLRQALDVTARWAWGRVFGAGSGWVVAEIGLLASFSSSDFPKPVELRRCPLGRCGPLYCLGILFLLLRRLTWTSARARAHRATGKERRRSIRLFA